MKSPPDSNASRLEKQIFAVVAQIATWSRNGLAGFWHGNASFSARGSWYRTAILHSYSHDVSQHETVSPQSLLLGQCFIVANEPKSPMKTRLQALRAILGAYASAANPQVPFYLRLSMVFKRFPDMRSERPDISAIQRSPKGTP